MFPKIGLNAPLDLTDVSVVVVVVGALRVGGGPGPVEGLQGAGGSPALPKQ